MRGEVPDGQYYFQGSDLQDFVGPSRLRFQFFGWISLGYAGNQPMIGGGVQDFT